jgi:hypothetical protein
MLASATLTPCVIESCPCLGVSKASTARFSGGRVNNLTIYFSCILEQLEVGTMIWIKCVL